MNETAFNTSALNRSALDASALCGGGARRQRGFLPPGFLPPGTPKAIREALVCWYDPARQGCTNESMAANPVLRDLSGNGHDLACHNFAWSGMSGIGGYAFDIPDPVKGRFEYTKIGDSKFVFHKNIVVGTYLFIFSNYINSPQKIRVTNLPNGSTIYFHYDSTQFGEKITQDGEYAIPLDTIEAGTVVIKYSGITLTTNIEGFTFEFLPEYPNAIVSDGVDDYCRAEGLPLLTDYTVIAKRDIFDTSYRGNGNILATKATLGDSNGAFQFERISANDGTNGTFTIVSFCGFNRPAQQPNGVSWMTSESYNGTPINKGTAIDSTKLSLLSRGAVNPMKCALYSFLLFDRTLSEEEIEWVKENMVNGYPSPVAYYDCSKYSNGDMGSNPVLEDLSGNGHDLELHNFAFAGMSGFDGFPIALKSTFPRDFTGDSQYESTQEYIQINSLRTVAGLLQVRMINSIEDYIEIPSFRIKVSGVSEAEETYPGLTFRNTYHYVDADGTHKTIDVSNDGEHVLPKSTIPAEKVTGWLGFVESHNINVIPENGTISVSIRIELIPEHPGGLVFDGVDDYGVGSRESFDKCTMFILLKPLVNSTSFLSVADFRNADTYHSKYFAVVRPSTRGQIAYNHYNSNGTYINNLINNTIEVADLLNKKHLITVKGNVVDNSRFALGTNWKNNIYFDNMVLYKFLLFDNELSQKQMDKVIQDYQLMDDVDDVWNEQ